MSSELHCEGMSFSERGVFKEQYYSGGADIFFFPHPGGGAVEGAGGKRRKVDPGTAFLMWTYLHVCSCCSPSAVLLILLVNTDLLFKTSFLGILLISYTIYTCFYYYTYMTLQLFAYLFSL